MSRPAAKKELGQHFLVDENLLGVIGRLAQLERDYYVSFAGNATYKNASDLRLAATQVPAERILAETDAPYLAPQPVRGRRNEPAFVMHTLAALAQARDEDPDELERQIDRNATACFALP